MIVSVFLSLWSSPVVASDVVEVGRQWLNKVALINFLLKKEYIYIYILLVVSGRERVREGWFQNVACEIYNILVIFEKGNALECAEKNLFVISSWEILTFGENPVANSETGWAIVRYALILYEEVSAVIEVISMGKERMIIA